MTRSEAEAFLARNPRIRATLEGMRDDDILWKLEDLWLFGDAGNEADARVNVIKVAEAVGWWSKRC